MLPLMPMEKLEAAIHLMEVVLILNLISLLLQIVQLNFNKPGNYAFFCPVSRVHLTRSNPVAFVNEVTPYINRGLKSKAILDVTETTGQKAEIKQEKAVEKPAKVKEEPKVEKVKVEEPVQPVMTEPVEEKKEEVKEEPKDVKETTKAPTQRKKKQSSYK